LLTPNAGGSPEHIAQGQDSRSLPLAWTLLWPSLHSIVTCDSFNETLRGIAKTMRSDFPHPDKAWRGKGYLSLEPEKA